MNSLTEKALFILESPSNKIPTNNSTPDKLYFDDKVFRWYVSAGPFAFIGEDEVLVYCPKTFENHHRIYTDILRKDLKNLKCFGELSNYDYKEFEDFLDHESDDNVRILTKAGRIWNIDATTSVVTFWCNERKITKENLESLKENLKLKEFYWAAMDSKFFNHYGSDDKNTNQSNTKEYHSVRHPEYTHDKIVKIITKMHSNSTNLTPIEHEILVDIGFEKNKSKLYPKGYHNITRTSEDIEQSNVNLIERALSILESSSNKIPTNRANPNDAYFEGHYLEWSDGTGIFAFLGEKDGTLVYDEYRYAHHPDLFNKISNLYNNHKLNIDDYLKGVGIDYFGKLTLKDIEYAHDTQGLDDRDSNLSKPRTETRSGRLWKNVGDDKASVIVFWCNEKDIRKSDLASLKKNLKLKEFYWAAMDSKFFNRYGNVVKELGGKDTEKLSYPGWSHENLVALLGKAHTKGLKNLSVEEQKIVKALGFRSTLDLDIADKVAKRQMGSFQTMAQKRAATQQESTEY